MCKSGFLLFFLILAVQSMKSQTPLPDSVALVNPVSLSENVIVNPKGLNRSFHRLNAIKSGADSTFVIVHFGDSHIQMGHFSGTIEKNLQSAFGDAGTGMLFPYSACKSVGPACLKSNFSGVWEFNNITANASKIPIGLKCYGLKTTDTSAKFNFKFLTDNNPSAVKAVSVFHGANNYAMVCEAYKSDTTTASATSDWQISRFYNDSKSSDFSFTLKKTDESQSEFAFHGVLFESSRSRGVQYHHCGVVGAQFLQLTKNTPLLISQLSSLKPNLIIFSYGSNESYMPNFDSVAYFREITKLIDHIKAEIPGVEILITSTPDTRSNNRYPLHKNEINRTLRKIAARTDAAYWDLNAVMGGDKTMDLWRNAGLAQKDKLHFSKPGYQLQGNLLSMAFFNAFNKSIPNSIQTSGLQTEIEGQMSAFAKKTVVSQPKENPKTITHTVKKGDTLSNIAKRYQCSVASIQKTNNLSTTTIRIGDTLTILPNGE